MARMTVYCLLFNDNLMGAYSSPELAMAATRRRPQPEVPKLTYWRVQPVELDAPPRSRGRMWPALKRIMEV